MIFNQSIHLFVLYIPLEFLLPKKHVDFIDGGIFKDWIRNEIEFYFYEKSIKLDFCWNNANWFLKMPLYCRFQENYTIYIYVDLSVSMCL